MAVGAPDVAPVPAAPTAVSAQAVCAAAEVCDTQCCAESPAPAVTGCTVLANTTPTTPELLQSTG